MTEIVGGSLTAVTDRAKDVLVVRLPSFTVTVMVEEPDWLAAGVAITVRLAPLPPNVRPAFGTSAVFDELPEIVRLSTAVSMSATAIAIAPVGASSFVV